MKDLLNLIRKQEIPKRSQEILEGFASSYAQVLKKRGFSDELTQKNFLNFLHAAIEHFTHPYQFALYHKSVRKPFDYHQFGIDFIEPLIDLEKSTITGEENLKKIDEFTKRGENVILLANHQTESDPQIWSVMLKETYPELAQNLILVAGERVIKDPVAIPFSLGCNLLCIYSKKHIENPPEEQHRKQLHNKETMEKMRELLTEGGKCIYVAPSGGRDRPDEKGEIAIAPFDPKSIEMFYLMAKKAKTPVHFFSLTMDTYLILPPPDTLEKDLGERRITIGGPVHLGFGDEIDMESFPGSDESNKQARRQNRANYIWDIVDKTYKLFPKDK
ncbi:MAG: 1-acyl-sn-glycerol-3-phosphate acyltransferase [Candidatus Algichlamydia australiensis]|nr:1-acyl-sn-glycerol-3-phosphate acyltransferase [Chlamydiales bacterium]